MASNDPMRFVYYNIRSDQVPEEFHVPKELNELMTMKVAKYDFDKEKKLVENYTRLSRTASHEPAVKFSDNDRLRQSPVTTHPTGKDTRAEPEKPRPPTPPPPPPRLVSQSSRPNSGVVNEFEFRQGLVERMMQETKQEQGVCHFFLESTEWNFDQALDMFGRMSIT